MPQVTMYDNLKFPEYRFREYPKMVYPPGGPVYAQRTEKDPTPAYPVPDADPHLVGKPVGFLVHSEEEEIELMDAAPSELDSVGLDALRTRAEQLMITVDGRWGMSRLREEIAKTESH